MFCDKHAVKARASMVSGKKADEIARDDNELKRLSAMVKEKKDETRASMELRVGDSTVMCSRCGYPIDRGQEVIASGLLRYHQACPTKEEAESQTRSVRHFVKKLPDRLVVQLTCDAQTHYSFLYEIDRDSFNDQLRKKSNEPAKVLYLPDTHANASAVRKLPDKPDFDLVMKDPHFEYSFSDPKSKHKTAPVLSDAKRELVLSKFHLGLFFL